MGRIRNNLVNVGVGFLIVILVFGVWQFFSWEKKSNNEYVYNQLQTWIDKQEKVVNEIDTTQFHMFCALISCKEDGGEESLGLNPSHYPSTVDKIHELKNISPDARDYIVCKSYQHGTYANSAKYAREYLENLKQESRIELENNNSQYFKDIQEMLDEAEKNKF